MPPRKNDPSLPKRGPGRPRKSETAVLIATKQNATQLLVAIPAVAPPKANRVRVKQKFPLADDVVVTMEFWSDVMPDWNARQNFVTIMTGEAKGAGAPVEAFPTVGLSRPRAGAAEESRTNINNMRGFGMTRGTMDPVEALNGIPGLTATDKAVQRTLDAVEESTIESELSSIPDDDDLQPETLPS